MAARAAMISIALAALMPLRDAVERCVNEARTVDDRFLAVTSSQPESDGGTSIDTYGTQEGVEVFRACMQRQGWNRGAKG